MLLKKKILFLLFILTKFPLSWAIYEFDSKGTKLKTCLPTCALGGFKQRINREFNHIPLVATPPNKQL